MSELDQGQLDELQRDLRALQSELQEAILLSEDGVKPVDLDEPIGRVSRIDAIQQQKMAQNNRAGHKARLRMVSIALAALDSGDYGLCVECGLEIGEGRLKVYPYADECIECAEFDEHRRRHST